MAAPKRRREEEEAAEDVIVVEEEEDETRDETEHDTEDEGSDANAEADEEEEMEEAEADDNETASASGQIIHILDESDEESTSIAPSSPDLSAPPEWLSFDVGCVQRQVQVAQEIAAALQPHQREGLRFMWKHVAQEEGSGCILADGMGLGKTLQAIALVHTCLRALVVRTALVLCPAICVRNWADEVDKWTPDVLAKPFLLQDDHGLVGKLRTLERWRKEGGLLVLSYESFLSLASPRSLRPRQDRSCSEQEESGGLVSDRARQLLLDPGPGLVVLDEGHRIRTETSLTSSTVMQLKTRRRVVLSGYPVPAFPFSLQCDVAQVQNKPLEYLWMIRFVRPERFPSKKLFQLHFEQPIRNGQCWDSSEFEQTLSRR